MDIIAESFKILSNELKECYNYPNNIQIYETVPSKLEFSKVVNENRPIIIKNAMNNWNALYKWDNNYLREVMNNKDITVDISPHAKYDSIVNDIFVTPYVLQMKFNDFMDIFENNNNNNNNDDNNKGVPCIQHQNSNLSKEFQPLLQDIKPFDFAEGVLGDLDATNIWMGVSSKQCSSVHKDPYENLYGVIRGKKYFTLFPPTDLPYMNYKEYKLGEYDENMNINIIKDDKGKNMMVNWIPHGINMEEEHPNYNMMTPINIELAVGDVLYLPSLWFHRVRNDANTIAVNYWYDMKFDIKYAYFRFLEHLTQSLA